MTTELLSLGSGSCGNMFLVRCGNTRIAVDDGISCRAAERGMTEAGHNPSSLDAILITHEHSDHIAGLPIFTKKHPLPVHAAGQSADAIRCAEGCLVRHDPLYTAVIGDISVRSFLTPHDSACSVGYILTCPDCTIGIATDLGCVSPEMQRLLGACDYVVLESNHDLRMLEHGPYPPYLIGRIESPTGHLSNDDCAGCVVELAAARTKSVLLAHLSEQNNTPELALIATRTALDRAGFSRFPVTIAARSGNTRML